MYFLFRATPRSEPLRCHGSYVKFPDLSVLSSLLNDSDRPVDCFDYLQNYYRRRDYPGNLFDYCCLFFHNGHFYHHFPVSAVCRQIFSAVCRQDLSRIAGKYIDQYYTRFGISKDAPEPIDPERLASAVLGLNVKMLPLCSDGSVLGLTVFQRCGFTVTLGDGTKLVEIFMPKDVVIDSALAADGCTGCRNFTIAHEAAHQILADLFPNDYGKAVKCRGHIAYRERNGQPSWEEWQANTLAAELLMPTFLVNAEIERAALCLPNGILYKSASDPNYEKILEMAARMGVSWSAIRIRLQQMQVINGKPIHCHPLDVIRFGE